MIAKYLLPALTAAVGLVSAQNDPCSQSTITINSQADVTNLGRCRTIKGNVVIGNQTDTEIDLSGIQTIQGDLTLTDNKVISSLKSTSLASITGEMHLQNLIALNNLAFSALSSVGSIKWQTLTALDSLSFTTGLTTAKSVIVSDTFLSTLDGLDMLTVGIMDINNNRRLVNYQSKLTNLTDNLNINANGLNFKVSFPSLIWIANMTVSNVSTFDAPALTTVNGSMRFDSNFFTSFSAPNLTSTGSGDISFVSNGMLANITMPQLTTVGGGFLIANNTGLQKVSGFGKMKTVGGAVKLRGNFTDVQFPSLNDVKGAFDVVSTADIKASCDNFGKLAPSSQGGGGQIQGTYNCQSNDANANSDTGTGTSSGGNPNSAAGVALNMAAVLGLTIFGCLFQALL